MARNRNAEVDVPDSSETDAPESTEAKAPKGPKRGELPEGFVTPIGLAKELTTRGLHTNRDGETVEVKPQMVYSYIKNAPADHPFPLQSVEDSNGTARQVVSLEEGLAWWVEKTERAQARRANAAEKRTAKEQRAAERTAKAEAEGDTSEVTEAE